MTGLGIQLCIPDRAVIPGYALLLSAQYAPLEAAFLLEPDCALPASVCYPDMDAKAPDT